MREHLDHDRNLQFQYGENMIITEIEMELALHALQKKKKAQSWDNIMDIMFHTPTYKRLIINGCTYEEAFNNVAPYN